MRLWTTAIVMLALASCTPPAPEGPAGPPQPVAVDAPSGEYALDANHSSVVIRANRFGLAYYTLIMADVSGTLNFNAEDPTQSSVSANVAANSVRTEYPGARNFDDELQNSQWLNAAEFPTLTFTSTSVELTGPNTGRMTGDLTIRGVTHPTTFDVTFNRAYRQDPTGLPVALLGFSATGTFKRSDYGMTVLLPATSGGVGVADEVNVQIEAVFAHPPAPTNPAN